MRQVFSIVFVLLVSTVSHAESRPLFKAGLGSGVGYAGVAGIGLEAEWNRLALLAGAGRWGEFLTWEVGGRYYFNAPGIRIRSHITASVAPTHWTEYKILAGPEAGRYEALYHGLNVLGGLDHDFGKPGGFQATYGLGAAFPGDLPEEDRRRIEDVGGTVAGADPAVAFSLGIKYQF